MKNIALLALSILILTACKKKKEEGVVSTHYPQEYAVIYYKAQDSMIATGSLAGKSAMYDDKGPVSMTMNGTIADNYVEIGKNYTWYFKGLSDVSFNFSTHGNNIINSFTVHDIKLYEFANIPDTMSVADWKTIEMSGPAMAGGDGFDVQIYFSDKVLYRAATITNVYKLPQTLLDKGIPKGKTRLSMTWYSNVKPLQMQDANEGGTMRVVSVVEKEVWLQ